MFILLQKGFTRSSSLVRFNPQDISFTWEEFKDVFTACSTHSFEFSNQELSQLFYSMFELITVEDLVTKKKSLINPTVDRLRLDYVQSYNETGILDDSKVTVTVVGPKLNNLKRMESYQVQNLDFRHILLKKLDLPLINENAIAGFSSMLWKMSDGCATTRKNSIEIFWTKFELVRLFDVPKWKQTRTVQMEKFLLFVVSGIEKLLGDAGEVSLLQDGISVTTERKQLQALAMFSSNYILPAEIKSKEAEVNEKFTLEISYPNTDLFLKILNDVSIFNISNNEEDIDSLKTLMQFKRELLKFLNFTFSKAWENSSTSYKENKIWEKLVKKNKELANIILFTYQSNLRESKGRLYQGKTPSAFDPGNTSLVSMPRKFKKVYWKLFGESWNRSGQTVITNLDFSAAHANIAGGILGETDPIVWDALLEVCTKIYKVDISRSDFKQLILSSYNGKIWDKYNLADFGLKKLNALNMLQYLQKERFPKLGVEFCEVAKQRTYFLGQKMPTQKKGKPNFILANVELILVSGLLLDLVNNKNQILSYEYDGVIFEGSLPEEKRTIYNQICNNLLGFIIPISTEELYSSNQFVG